MESPGSWLVSFRTRNGGTGSARTGHGSGRSTTSSTRAWASSEVPVLYGLPVGHGATMATLPLGVQATLDADALTLTIDEPALV